VLETKELVMQPYQTYLASAVQLAAVSADRGVPHQPATVTERLPFTVRRVESEDDMRKAVQIRQAAYARHIPQFAETLGEPEASDYADGALVLLAESRLDGKALGSLRIQTNLHRPLSVEQSVDLPEWLSGRRLAEVTRLGIDEGRVGRMVKTALLKAAVQYCKDNDIAWALATGRAPIDRQYEQLLFVDVIEDKLPVPLRHVGNIPHRVMAFEIGTLEARWKAAQHPLLNFFCYTRHPDIDIAAKTAPRPGLSVVGAGHDLPSRQHVYERAAA
jgi:GNAT superfamily N-acetyltransferase